ncbi:uncharacterized protein LOC119386960 isoform X1 [Rhipicephalus sanguineus]|uniref:uncharacterized protein LOC119386960 isoform X1 n=1 Tax=Rhipicephalus sanguineus TaxID=34632 RepID=UPI001895DD45|nr:uncharacterized protein LOC119386960 isoform X1 [Rhipicephalus sanguineus]
MLSLFSCLLLILSALFLAVPMASGKAKHQLKHDTTDAFKLLEVFPYAIALFDADQDGDLECVMMLKEHLDQNKKTTSYVMLLPPLNGRPAENHTYHAREGAAPDKLLFTLDDGVDEQSVNFIYTNYKNCVVVDIPFKNKQSCGLWVKKDALHSLPQECLDQFEDNCDMAFSRFDDETCKGLFDNV